MAKQFDLDGPCVLSVTFYAGFHGRQMAELTARQAFESHHPVQLRITLDEFLALLKHAEIREEAERRKA